MRWPALLPVVLAACAGGAPPAPDDVQADLVIVDKSDRELTLMRDGEVLRTFTGLQFGAEPHGHKQFEGDERTPEGRYTIDWRNPDSSYHLSLQISYPNADDIAFAEGEGRDPGGDIMLHGQPNWLPFGSLPGDWTDGCIALSNAEMDALWAAIPNGTPIEIRP